MTRRGCLALLWLLSVGAVASQAQVGFARGQNIAPAYEGWELNEDGSFDLVFGYMNRNWEEEIDVPIGPENAFAPGAADQGQPTHFQPRRNRFVFRIQVPADFGDQELVWTLSSNGKTEHAYGTLRPDYYIDNFVLQANNGAGGAGGTMPDLAGNTVPMLDVESPSSTKVTVGQPLALEAMVTDDGYPRSNRLGATNPRFPSRITTDSTTGLRVAWFVYRGEGEVRFDPPQTKTWEDTREGQNSSWSPGWRAQAPPAEGRWLASATFDEPGVYVLRCQAHDGGLSTHGDISVTVIP